MGRQVGHWQIPVGEQYLETPLLFALIGRLIGPELLDEARFIGIVGSGQRLVLEPDSHAIIPARILRHVVSRLLDFE